MSASDVTDVIQSLRSHVGAMRERGAQVSMADFPADELSKFNPEANGRPQIVLASESYAELGGPKLGSRAAVLATAQSNLVTDGRITVVGPTEFSEGGSYSWGMAVLVACPEDADGAYLQVKRQNLTNVLDGCMLKSPLEKPWCRIGGKAAERGIRPMDVAAAYLAATKASLNEGLAGDCTVEAVMELAAPHELGEFASLLQFEESRFTDVLGKDMSSRGIDLNCVPGSHCGSCSDKKACAEVRKIQRARNAVAAAAEKEGIDA